MKHPLIKTVLGQVYDFGYGQPDCRVYRYWENPPFTTNRRDLRCILFARNGRFMVVATDFGDGGACRVTLDRERLGGGGSGLRATTPEPAAPLRTDGASVAFDLRKHDFVVLLITPENP